MGDQPGSAATITNRHWPRRRWCLVVGTDEHSTIVYSSRFRWQSWLAMQAADDTSIFGTRHKVIRWPKGVQGA